MVHAEQTLPAADFDFRALFESVPALYLILNSNFTIIAVSDAYLTATLTKRNSVIGQNLFDVFPDNPNDPQSSGPMSLRQSLNRVLETKAREKMAVLRYDVPKPDSLIREFEEKYWSPVNIPVLNLNSEILYIIHAVEDFTDMMLLERDRATQQQENEALRTVTREAYAQVEASEAKLKSLVNTILDTLIDGVITLNAQRRIQSYNQACVGLFQYRPDEVIGRDIQMLLAEPYREGESRGHETSGRRCDGTVFPLELAIGRTSRGGEHASVAILRNITERRENEKARDQLRQAQKMESLGQLTGGIAHDFNNLLAVILGNLDFMMEETPEDHALRVFIHPSIQAAEHGAELTKQLLAFGRKQALQPRVTAMNDLLKNFTSLVRHTLGERIQIVTVPGTDLWNVYVDPNLLQNALLNLAVNARDAMPDGGKLIIETKNTLLDADYALLDSEVLPGEYAVIAVSDTGEGMAAAVIEKAFEPFFTTKEVGKGSGLGLSMVYGFVKQSQGHIRIYSELGHGTSIKIYLPRAHGALLSERGTDRLRLPPATVTRVLVVEDNKDVLRLSAAMVESLGYEVLQAETGDAAMEILRARDDITLLLTDVMLPGAINGPVLAKQAVALHPELKVLFNSGYAEHAILQSGLLEEGVHLIGKPFRKQQLAAKIEEVLKA